MELFFQIGQVIFALAVVLGIFYLLVKFMKDKNFYNQTNQMKILERCHLGKEQKLCLVKIVDKVWLIAVTADKIEFLEEVELSQDIKQQQLNLLNLFQKGKDVEND